MTEEGSIKLRFTGGPAFPTQPIPDGAMAGFTGMMLRDWFAGMALQGILSKYTLTSAGDDAFLARVAFSMADSMLAERGK